MKVLLFSGGLDSFIISRLEKFDMGLYIHLGLPEQDKELSTINMLPFSPPVIIDRRLNLAEEKLSNDIIPMRNLFFAMIGAYYGNEVTLGATAGDTTGDKTIPFMEQTNTLLNYLFENKAKAPTHMKSENFRLRLPYKHLTKTQLVEAYLVKGENPNYLLYTRSCYAHAKQECGICRSCVRKYTALTLNGINCEKYFMENPKNHIENAYNLAVEKNRGQETEEFKLLLERINNNGL